MNPLHLLWVCPLCASFGALWLALLIGGRDKHE